MAVGADHLLLDTVRRRLKQPAGWVAVALHLSRLPPPAPRPHHRRIARVLMEDAARRHDGLVLALGNGDLLLLARAGTDAGTHGAGADRKPPTPMRVATPQALPEVLARLLRADAPAGREVVSFWPLDSAGEKILAYAQDRVASTATIQPGPADPRQADPKPQPGAAEAIAMAMSGPDAIELLHRQTAVLITDAGMRPLFREIRFTMSSLESRILLPLRAESDPYLFRHLAEQLDRRLLGLLDAALGDGEAMDAAGPGAPRLHVNMTLAGLRSDLFARFTDALAARGLSLGVEISLLEACADPDRFEAARAALHRLDMILVIDGVSHQTLRLARVAALQPDLVKLAWSPRMAGPDNPPDDAEARLIRDLGPDRVLLHHAETEAALRWGLERGIRRFQGRHVDAMLGALRLSMCGFAVGCTLQQCIERAAATDRPGRRLCLNHGLLDAGLDAGLDANVAALPPVAAPLRVTA